MDKLIERIIKLSNPTVAGLDPQLEFIPEHIIERSISEHGETLEAAAAAVLEFNRGLIDALCDVVPAVKPQSAFFERLGYPGVRVLYETVQYAKSRGMYVIIDGKRNDIGSTAQAYSQAYLGEVTVGKTRIKPYGGDCLTVNAYLGSDGLNPFLEACKAMDTDIFILAKTSDPSAGELQDKIIDGEPVYNLIAKLTEGLASGTSGKYGFSKAGLVVGATYPSELKELREKFPSSFFLVPGYGAQGGTAADIAAAFNKDGIGAVVNSSRGIMRAWQQAGTNGEDFAEKARAEALNMKNELLKYIG